MKIQSTEAPQKKSFGQRNQKLHRSRTASLSRLLLPVFTAPIPRYFCSTTTTATTTTDPLFLHSPTSQMSTMRYFSRTRHNPKNEGSSPVKEQCDYWRGGIHIFRTEVRNKIFRSQRGPPYGYGSVRPSGLFPECNWYVCRPLHAEKVPFFLPPVLFASIFLDVCGPDEHCWCCCFLLQALLLFIYKQL